MRLKSKTNFLLRIALCVALAVSSFGAVLGFVGDKLTAKAETVEYQDILAVENRSWGAASDEYYFGGYTIGASTANNAHWLNTADSVNGCWYHGNEALITANNGVDILKYIYVNDTSARDAITANVNSFNQMVGSNGWLTNPAASPVYVETTNGSGLLIKILKAYAGENFTLTFKAGFSLIRNDGNVIYLSDDVVYNCAGNVPTRVNKNTVTFNDEHGVAVSTKRVVNGQAIGTLPKVPEKTGYGGFWTIGGTAITENTVISSSQTATPVYGIEYEDLLGLEDRAWGAHEGEYYFGGVTLSPFGYFNTATSVSTTWHADTTAPITANAGVDIMKYILVNGVSARSLIEANANGDRLSNSCGCWLSNPAAYPVYVETTNGSGIIIRLAKAAFGDNFTFTFKEGFSLIRNDGQVIYLSNDVTYTYANGVLGGRTVDKKYSLTFDGVGEEKELRSGEQIGTLPAIPAIPEKAGCEGVWTIDGVEITAETVYNYGANKTATVVYSKDITETIGLGDWGVPESESDIRYLWIRDNNVEIATAYPNSYWNDHPDNKDSNYGVDIMEYILIDGESARSIINANVAGTTSYKAASTFPLNIGGCYAPVCIETAGDGIRFKVMVDYKTSFEVTFKAGFTLVSNGVKLCVSRDVVYSVGATMGDINKVEGHTLSFDGIDDVKKIENGQAIGTLPAVPAREGYVGFWTIDGEIISAETIYNYGISKTAKAVYKLEYKDLLGLEDRTSWASGGHADIVAFGLMDFSITEGNQYFKSSVAGCWYKGNDGVIAANNGLDILEYVYLNGVSARALLNGNTEGKVTANTGSWLSNPAAWPIAFETGADCWIRIDKTAFEGGNFTITFKAGFELTRSDDERIYLSEDVIYKYVNGTLAKRQAYTLTFEGVGEVRTVFGGESIGELPDVPEKEGFLPNGWAIDGTIITADTIYNYGANKTAVPQYATNYVLSFEGIADTVTVFKGEAIGELPAVPKKEDLDGVWTIDGVEIDENTVYTYDLNKTAKASYSKDITKYIAIEDRAWGAHAGEFYLGVLDMRADNNVNDTYYLNSTIAQTWYHGNNTPIAENNGLDIMEYILINGVSARKLITDNANGAGLKNDCVCWLSNPAASPVYVETTNGSGIMVRILEAHVGNYFEITLKSGFSLINEDGARVYLTADVSYKYIVTSEGTTFAKGELTDDDLDMLNGQEIKLMNGNEEYFVKTTCRLTLPEIAPIILGEEGISQVLVGWTTDPEGLSDLYPVGYKMDVTEEIQLYAVWIGFELQDGAAVRLASGSSGIRFLTDIDAGGYKLGVDKGLITGVGTFLVPTDYLETGVEFAHSSFGEGYYLDKATETWKVNGESDATWTYTAAFVNISEKQYSRRFSARGYLKIQFTTGEGYVYTPYVEENNARSIYDVALAAYNDEENPQYKENTVILNYINKVANITWNDADYTFAKTAGIAGDYEITGISTSGNTVTVSVDGDVSSAIINGKRIVTGNSSNVKMGNFVFNVNSFAKTAEGFTFNFGAANKTYDKESEETLRFASSDKDLDFFLNDYFKRHSAYVEDGENLKVNTAIGGVNSQEFFSQEWLTTAYYWYNSFEGYTDEKGNNQDRIAGLRKFLSSVPVDDYGYVWSSNDSVRDPKSEVATGEQKMGWPFPNNDTVSTSHWEFNSGNESWSSNISASASDGLYGKNLSNQSSNITFTSKSFSGLTSKKVYTFYAPLLEFEVRIDDATNIEDIYVWYSTSSSTSFSEDKKLSVKDKAFLNYDLGNTSGAYNHILYLPMYAESAWGESTSTYLKQLKIEIALKSGKTISGNVALNYVRPTLDTRMSNNNSILISSLRTDYDYTGDLDFLVENITRARKALNFLMQMYDSSRSLKRESYLVGHGGTKESLNWLGNASAESIASSISQGYWDIMYMPEYDFQSNTYFYKALVDMAYLESVLAEAGVKVSDADYSEATIKLANRLSSGVTVATSPYAYGNSDLTKIASQTRSAMRKNYNASTKPGFWNPNTGRFVAGVDGDGVLYDYGYVAWNLEAIYYGVATDAQKTSIMSWLEGESDLYKYVFAPKSITVTGDASALNGEYEAQGDKWVNCQFGGAIMYTSFYDLMARIDTLGADNAFARLQAIQEWYEKVYAYYVEHGSNPEDFYRYYYDANGIQMQGMGTAGVVGIDDEFLESFLPVSAVANGFFGIDANANSLTVAPELPTGITEWKMENLAFNFVKYDLTVYKGAIQLNNVRGETEGLTLTVTLDCGNGQSVYVNGVKVDNATVKNGKATVTVDFGATIVEVK